MRATLIDNQTKDEWYRDLEALPGKGDEVFLHEASKEVLHGVTRIVHDIGGGKHKALVFLDGIQSDYEKFNR